MKRLYRCYACLNEKGFAGLDFIGEKPICPNCKIDGQNPRFAEYISIREVVHLDPPVDHPILRHSVGMGHPACDPKIEIAKRTDVRASGDPRAVTCPHCHETSEFKIAMQGIDSRGVIPERDTPIVAVTPSGGVRFETLEAKGNE
jgi:hypothetical protein